MRRKLIAASEIDVFHLALEREMVLQGHDAEHA